MRELTNYREVEFSSDNTVPSIHRAFSQICPVEAIDQVYYGGLKKSQLNIGKILICLNFEDRWDKVGISLVEPICSFFDLLSLLRLGAFDFVIVLLLPEGVSVIL